MSRRLRITPRQAVTAAVAATVFVLCAIYIARSFQWQQIWGMLQVAHWGWLFIIVPFTILAYWGLRALRWHILLSALKADVRFYDVYMSTAVSVGLASYTPFQSGEAMKVEMLKRTAKVSRPAGYGSFALEKGLDLLTVALLAVIAMLAGFDVGVRRPYVVGLLVVLVFGAIVGAMCIARMKGTGKVGLLFENLRLCTANKGVLAGVAATTVGSWILVALGWQVCLRSLSIDLGLVRSIGLMAVVAMMSVFSFIPGAIGVHEAGTAACLIRLGYDPACAQGGAVILRFYGLLGVLLALLHLLACRVARGPRRPGTKEAS